MNDKLDHFVLEYDDASGNALLAMTEGDGSRIADGAGLPYALARGYDADARTWESIEPFDDVTRAKLRYEKACGREYGPTGGKLYDDECITLRWRREDISDSLESDFGHFGVPIPATGDVYLFGSSLGKSLAVEDADEDDIAPALREVRTYCKDATEKRDPQLICAKAQAAAAKSATAEGDAGGKKL